MAVSKKEYGNWYSLEGTLAECMAELKGKPKGELAAIAWDGSTSCIFVCYHKVP